MASRKSFLWPPWKRHVPFKRKDSSRRRNAAGKIVDGFDLGNSPYSYMKPEMKGQTVVLTTTNGTKAINMAKDKDTVVIGSLNNLDALCAWLIRTGA